MAFRIRRKNHLGFVIARILGMRWEGGMGSVKNVTSWFEAG